MFAPAFRALRRTMTTRRVVLPLAVGISAMVAAGCGGGDGGTNATGTVSTDGDTNGLVVYSGRDEELVGSLYDRFEEETGIELSVRYADSAELAATLQEEGENSPADVFYGQDTGSVGAVEGMLAPLPKDLLDRVPAEYRDEEGRWVGVSGRVRVLVYNTERVKESELPTSVTELTDERFNGNVGVAPSNASFVGFVSGMRQVEGDEATRQWLDAMAANDAQVYEKNSMIVDAVARGEVDFGLVNHYYLYAHRDDNPDAPVANHFFQQRDPGLLVNASSVGIVATSDRSEDAQRFIEFMLAEGQEHFANESAEYPLARGYEPGEEDLRPLSRIQPPKVDLGELGMMLEESVRMIEESQLGS